MNGEEEEEDENEEDKEEEEEEEEEEADFATLLFLKKGRKEIQRLYLESPLLYTTSCQSMMKRREEGGEGRKEDEVVSHSHKRERERSPKVACSIPPPTATF